MHNKTVHMVAFLLLVVGGLNWLLYGLFGWDLGMLLGGSDAILTKGLYVLFGLAAIVEIVSHKGHCKECSGGDKEPEEDAPSESTPSQQQM